MEDTDELREFRMQWQEELQEVDEGSSQLADSSEQEKSVSVDFGKSLVSAEWNCHQLDQGF
eukprot:m.30228 g.30228  ORF g.30228 m.30228 type:complete len:61 (+) comp31322_c0_seq4:41-223(+)